jgi:hypothetical protein
MTQDIELIAELVMFVVAIGAMYIFFLKDSF